MPKIMHLLPILMLIAWIKGIVHGYAKMDTR